MDDAARNIINPLFIRELERIGGQMQVLTGIQIPDTLVKYTGESTSTSVEVTSHIIKLDAEKKQYVLKMASTFGVVLEEGQVLHATQLADKGEINKYLLGIKQGTQITLLEPTPADKGLLTKCMGENKQVYDLRSNIAAKQRDLHAREEMIERIKREILNNQTILGMLEARTRTSDDFIKAINDILTGGWFKLSSVNYTSGIIKMYTPDVYLNYRNATAGIDKTLNMGSYFVSIYKQENKVRVAPRTDNILVDGYFHPHINGSGQVCWGTAEEIYQTAMKSDKAYVQLFDALKIILQNYNGDSPYANFEEFLVKSPNFKIEDGDFAYKPTNSDYFIPDEDMPSDFHGDDILETDYCWEDEDGEDWYGNKVQFYRRTHIPTGVALPQDRYKYYYRRSDYSYTQYNGDINEL